MSAKQLKQLITIIIWSLIFAAIIAVIIPNLKPNLIEAAKNNDLKWVQFALEKGAAINAEDRYYKTALMWASEKGYTNIVRLLLEKGADVNTKGKYGQTALMWASMEGHTDIVRLLLEKGANVNAVDKHGYTALIWASRKSHTEIVNLLEQVSGKDSVKTDKGQQKSPPEKAVGKARLAKIPPAQNKLRELPKKVGSNARFTVDKTRDCLIDELTDLMWVRTPDSLRRTWQVAKDYANNLTLCGYSDWRLPNKDELKSLIKNPKQNHEWLNSQGFNNVQARYYWSSSTYTGSPAGVWVVHMYGGVVFADGKADTFYVWPVRSGAVKGMSEKGAIEDQAKDLINDAKKGNTAKGNAARGRTVYAQNCAMCHGDSGRGDGAAGVALNPKPRNFTDKTVMSRKTDDDLFKALTKGIPNTGMPPYERFLSEDDRWDAIAYIMTLEK